MIDAGIEGYLAKAEESIAGAESELAAGRTNNASSRAYYAAFQAAIVALLAEGVSVIVERGVTMSHKAVSGRFGGLLINRRKIYPSALGDVLYSLLELRRKADYLPVSLGQRQAAEAAGTEREFLAAVRQRVSSKGRG